MVIRLGLIGDNIKRSQSPRLHRLAGRLTGLDVTYDPLIPPDLGLDFDAVFDSCLAAGFRGINVTYPYKERVVARLAIDEPLVRSMGACNTVVFGTGTPKGFNTDCTGFVAAFRQSFPAAAPGVVAMAGAGGVGKAIAFALAELGALELRLFDPDRGKAQALARTLGEAAPGLRLMVAPGIEAAVRGADGLVNCTPIGMVGYPGTPIPGGLMTGASWAFDAVYTPVDTPFLVAAGAAGLRVLSGWELFFQQGRDAFRIFTGREVDADRLRAALLEPEAEEGAVA